MAKITGLGRGLGSLIPKKVAEAAVFTENRDFLMADSRDKVLHIPVNSIEANPMQPRRVFDHEGLEELIESIKVYGIIQPLIVSKAENGYQLIAGERRLRAAKILGLSTVPVLVREAKEQEKLELALIENVQRKNLNPIERALAYERLMNEFNLSQDDVSRKLGTSRSSVANTVRLLELPEAVQKALAEEKITEGHAKVIAGLSTEKEQLNFLNKVLQYNFTVRDAERESQRLTKRTRVVTRQSKDPLIEEKEDALRGILNTKVNIKKKGGQGQIIIDFYSDEELNSIVGQILK